MTRSFPAFLEWPLRFLTQRETPLSRYVLVTATISIIPVALIMMVAVLTDRLNLELVALIRPWPIRSYPTVAFSLGLADILIFSPFVETALALVPIWLLRKMQVPVGVIPLLAGILWGLVHCRGGSWIGMAQAWPFYCFTVILMTHEKPSLDKAWLIASSVHSLNNFAGLLVSIVLARIG